MKNGIVLLVSISFLIFASIVNGDVPDNELTYDGESTGNNELSYDNNNESDNNELSYDNNNESGNNESDDNNSDGNESAGDNGSTYNDRIPDAYKVSIDRYHGFYRVYDIYTGDELIGGEYEDKTLNIVVGDMVVWSIENMVVWSDESIESFSITSEPKLWSNESGHLMHTKQFNYTFNQSGVYNIYIKYTQKQTYPQQKIIVDIFSNKTTIEKARDIATNKTLNKTVNETKKDNMTEKSKVSIKIYRKNKETSGFEVVSMIPIIAIIVYIFRLKNGKNKDVGNRICITKR